MPMWEVNRPRDDGQKKRHPEDALGRIDAESKGLLKGVSGGKPAVESLDAKAIKKGFMESAIGRLSKELSGDTSDLEHRISFKVYGTDGAVMDLHIRGLELLKNGEYSRALAVFDDVASRCPDNSNLHASRAVCFYAVDRRAEAASAAEKALSLNPSNVLALQLRGTMHHAAGELENAHKYYSAANAIVPGDPAVTSGLLSVEKLIPPIENQEQLFGKVRAVWQKLGKRKHSLHELAGMTRHIRAGSEAIQAFLDSLQPKDAVSMDNAGLLLSALVNNSCFWEREITLTLRQPINFVGAGLKDRRLTINGSVGDFAGVWMENGVFDSTKLAIEGDAGSRLGSQMTGGLIEVHGNVKDYAGEKMGGRLARHWCDGHEAVDGRIMIHGNAGVCLGEGMSGGEIEVKGRAGMFAGSAMSGGKIKIGGNVSSLAGKGMSGGELIIEGNAGDELGKDMSGGKIAVVWGSLGRCGNAGNSVGSYMTGGEITVGGNAGDYAGNSMKGGSITLERDAGKETGYGREVEDITVHGRVASWGMTKKELDAERNKWRDSPWDDSSNWLDSGVWDDFG